MKTPKLILTENTNKCFDFLRKEDKFLSCSKSQPPPLFHTQVNAPTALLEISADTNDKQPPELLLSEAFLRMIKAGCSMAVIPLSGLTKAYHIR